MKYGHILIYKPTAEDVVMNAVLGVDWQLC